MDTAVVPRGVGESGSGRSATHKKRPRSLAGPRPLATSQASRSLRLHPSADPTGGGDTPRPGGEPRIVGKGGEHGSILSGGLSPVNRGERAIIIGSKSGSLSVSESPPTRGSAVRIGGGLNGGPPAGGGGGRDPIPIPIPMARPLFVVFSPFQAARDARFCHPRHPRFRDHPTGEEHRWGSDTHGGFAVPENGWCPPASMRSRYRTRGSLAGPTPAWLLVEAHPPRLALLLCPLCGGPWPSWLHCALATHR